VRKLEKERENGCQLLFTEKQNTIHKDERVFVIETKRKGNKLSP
jgi:hypothetical protein